MKTIKKISAASLLAFLFLVSAMAIPAKIVSADIAAAINARVLPTVWYSSLSVSDGDPVYIYAAIQNNSGINFSGVATFLVDDQAVASSAFSSQTNGLIDVYTRWIANPGNHSVRVSVATTLPAGKALYSYTSDKASISIIRKITPEIVQAAALNTAASAISSVDGVTSNWANQIETLKKPVDGTTADTASSSSAKISKISNTLASVNINKNSGASTVSATDKASGTTQGGDSSSSQENSSLTANIIDSPYVAIVWNFLISVAASLVRNWKWTLGGIFVLYLAYKVSRWARKV